MDYSLVVYTDNVQKNNTGASDVVRWVGGGEFLGSGCYSEHPSTPPSLELSVAVDPPLPTPSPYVPVVCKKLLCSSPMVSKQVCLCRSNL